MKSHLISNGKQPVERQGRLFLLRVIIFLKMLALLVFDQARIRKSSVLLPKVTLAGDDPKKNRDLE